MPSFDYADFFDIVEGEEAADTGPRQHPSRTDITATATFMNVTGANLLN